MLRWFATVCDVLLLESFICSEPVNVFRMKSSLILLFLLCSTSSGWASYGSASAAFIAVFSPVAKTATTSHIPLAQCNQETNSQPSFTLKQRNPYDVHVYYNGSNEREKAMLLRDKMKQLFPWMRFYQPKDVPIGPHPLPMWEADFATYDNRVYWSEVCEFIKVEHDELSVLIHPHSFDGDYADHTKNAFWVGDVLELRIQGWKH